MPNFPSGLVGPLLARQADIWPQETYRFAIVTWGVGGGGGGGALPDHCTCIPLVVPHRIEKLTELIADLRQPPIVEGSDVRHQPLAPDCTQMSEFNISLLDLRVSDNPFNICNLYYSPLPLCEERL